MSLHWNNIKGFPTSKQSLSNSNFVDFNVNFSNGSPFILFLQAFDLSEITKISHSNYTKSFLNRTGLRIYLYEPLSLRILENQYNFSYFSEFSADTDSTLLRASELDSIKEYVVKNNLTNVTVYTCDYAVEHHLPYYKQWFNTVCDDVFIKQIRVFPPYTFDKTKLCKKFMIPNWRYSKHRHLVTAYISKMSSNISWYFKCDFEILKNNLWFNLDSWKNTLEYQTLKEGVDYLNNISPCCLDLKTTTAIDVTNPSTCYWPAATNSPELTNNSNKILESFYKESFCVVVNETRFAQPTANFSEKLLDAVKRKKPFILVAPPKTLEYFKTFGYKSFEQFWNEDYDRTINHEHRLMKIFQLINNINNKSLEELTQIYSDMQGIVDHNFEVLMKNQING